MSNRRLLGQLIVTGGLLLGYFSLFPDTFAGLISLTKDAPAVENYSQSWGELQRNRSISKTPISIKGKRYWIGLGTHADSTIRLKIPPNAQSFEGACGIDDEARGYGEFTCSIRKNGEVVWKTPTVTQADPIHFFRIPVSPRDGVDLMVHRTPRGIDYAHANWVGLKFEVK